MLLYDDQISIVSNWLTIIKIILENKIKWLLKLNNNFYWYL